jgi:DNA-binding response OmpR family regulator
MSDTSRILVVSRDQVLLQTRKLILGTYFEVRTAARMSEAGSILSQHDFDLIVLCDTLSDSECECIAHMVADQRPMPTLLTLLGPHTGSHDRPVGRKLALTGGPLQLLRECAGALGVDLHGKQRTFTQ